MRGVLRARARDPTPGLPLNPLLGPGAGAERASPTLTLTLPCPWTPAAQARSRGGARASSSARKLRCVGACSPAAASSASGVSNARPPACAAAAALQRQRPRRAQIRALVPRQGSSLGPASTLMRPQSAQHDTPAPGNARGPTGAVDTLCHTRCPRECRTWGPTPTQGLEHAAVALPTTCSYSVAAAWTTTRPLLALPFSVAATLATHLEVTGWVVLAAHLEVVQAQVVVQHGARRGAQPKVAEPVAPQHVEDIDRGPRALVEHEAAPVKHRGQARVAHGGALRGPAARLPEPVRGLPGAGPAVSAPAAAQPCLVRFC